MEPDLKWRAAGSKASVVPAAPQLNRQVHPEQLQLHSSMAYYWKEILKGSYEVLYKQKKSSWFHRSSIWFSYLWSSSPSVGLLGVHFQLECYSGMDSQNSPLQQTLHWPYACLMWTLTTIIIMSCRQERIILLLSTSGQHMSMLVQRMEAEKVLLWTWVLFWLCASGSMQRDWPLSSIYDQCLIYLNMLVSWLNKQLTVLILCFQIKGQNL